MPKAEQYRSRADLMKEVQKQARQMAKMRAELQASKQTEPEPDADSDDDEDDALPTVPDEGIPFRPMAMDSLAMRTRRAVEADGRKFKPAAIAEPTAQIIIRPTAYVRSLFAKQRRGLGGFQSLHAAIQNRMAGSKVLALSPSDYARIVNYAVNYGEGGFQQSLRWLIALSVAESLGIAQRPTK